VLAIYSQPEAFGPPFPLSCAGAGKEELKHRPPPQLTQATSM